MFQLLKVCCFAWNQRRRVCVLKRVLRGPCGATATSLDDSRAAVSGSTSQATGAVEGPSLSSGPTTRNNWHGRTSQRHHGRTRQRVQAVAQTGCPRSAAARSGRERQRTMSQGGDPQHLSRLLNRGRASAHGRERPHTNDPNGDLAKDHRSGEQVEPQATLAPPMIR